MNTWQAISAFVGASVLLVVALLFMDERHLAADEKERLELLVAQTGAAVQKGVNANQLQLMRWELNDINARIAAGKPQVGDAARKVELEARIKKLVGK